jgi:microcystin-dependent protein
MADPFLSEIRIFSFNFAPVGWAECNGQLMSIAQNTALFSLIGTYYGGDGISNFALPDLRSRIPLDVGNGYVIGQNGGEETHTLLANEITHNHPVSVYDGNANKRTPVGNVPAIVQGSATNIYSSVAFTSSTNEGWGPTGGDQPHANLQPYLTLNFCIALQGIYPSRN